jgi:hypothetical protein
VVVWRDRAGGGHVQGLGHRYYTDCAVDVNDPGIPTISRGHDLGALLDALSPHTRNLIPRPGEDSGRVTQIIAAMTADIERLPSEPDETLK